jgi:hypothetical protein
MINGIWGNWFWAISSSPFTWTVTVNMPPSDVYAEASLAKVRGSGSASAYIFGYEFFDPASNTTRSMGFYQNPDMAPSFTYIRGTPSVRFWLTVNNMFGFATWKLYFL